MDERGRLKEAVEALKEKKGEEIRVLDIRGISSFADYFIIATALSQKQLTAMKDAVDEVFTKNGLKLSQVEGNRSSSWILLDYGDIVVHLFTKEDRLFYDLDRIWRDGKEIAPEDL